MPDELCEVLEICDGTGLISSAIISCGVHHLHELRRRKKRSFVFQLLFFTAADLLSFQWDKVRKGPV